ncbi:hypothetical protein POM88_012482 [Heracleum sosnowskyi]|uniref:Uncharacterized protein n=1 Tax=Heracleum sosnowskyi TaxID=360622 RepID=A0AAD8IXH5_9APIA|nr:hypothetical protein POM88_012482 [Heracleum sosnowskyi]
MLYTSLGQVLDQKGVGQLVKMATERGRVARPNLKDDVTMTNMSEYVENMAESHPLLNSLHMLGGTTFIVLHLGKITLVLQLYWQYKYGTDFQLLLTFFTLTVIYHKTRNMLNEEYLVLS